MTARLKTIRINLVEEKGWSPYDPGGNIMDFAINNAYEEFSHMAENDCIGLIDDLVGGKVLKQTGPKEWSPRVLTVDEDDLSAICEGLKEGVPELESTRMAIVDAFQWMWEEAYMPRDGDIEEAMERAIEETIDYDPLGNDNLWALLLDAPEKPWKTDEILRGVFDHVSYERQVNHYDRYIVFDFHEAKPVKDLLAAARKDPEWTVAQAERALEAEFVSFSRQVIGKLLDRLERIMEEVDAGQRTNFKPHWKAILADDDRMRFVRSEIDVFIRARRKEGSEGGAS